MRPNFYRRRNTPAYSFMAWASFAIAMGFEFIGIYNLDEVLSVRGYYAVSAILIVITAFLLQKVIRDNDEDHYLRETNYSHRMRNTAAFSFLAWAGFLLGVLFYYVGLYNLEQPLYVKGYYAIGGMFLIVTCLVLQKTIRDNEEDKLNIQEIEKSEVAL